MENDLNIALQHFWGSSYWTTSLQQAPELSSDTVKVLLAKSQEIDLLRAQLMRLQAKMQEPAPAETFRVGEFIEVLGYMNDMEWRRAIVVRVTDAFVKAELTSGPNVGTVVDRRIGDAREIRRPAAPEPELFKFGQRVHARCNINFTDYSTDSAIFIRKREKDGKLVLYVENAGEKVFSPDEVFPL